MNSEQISSTKDKKSKILHIIALSTTLVGFTAVLVLRIFYLNGVLEHDEANNVEIVMSWFILAANIIVWAIYFKYKYKLAELADGRIIDKRIPGLWNYPTDNCITRMIVAIILAITAYGVHIAIKWTNANGILWAILITAGPLIIWYLALLGHMFPFGKKRFIKGLDFKTMLGLIILVGFSFALMINLHTMRCEDINCDYSSNAGEAGILVEKMQEYQDLMDEDMQVKMLEGVDVLHIDWSETGGKNEYFIMMCTRIHMSFWNLSEDDFKEDNSASYVLTESREERREYFNQFLHGTHLYVKMIPSATEEDSYYFDYKLTVPAEYGVDILVKDWEY